MDDTAKRNTNKENYHEKKNHFFVLPLIAVLILVPLACSDKSQTEDSTSIKAADQSGSQVAQKAEEAQPMEVSSSIKGAKR